MRAAVDLAAQTVTVELPDRTRTTLDVVTARALQMVLAAAVYSSLRPVGPYLVLDRNHGDGWPAAEPAPSSR